MFQCFIRRCYSFLSFTSEKYPRRLFAFSFTRESPDPRLERLSIFKIDFLLLVVEHFNQKHLLCFELKLPIVKGKIHSIDIPNTKSRNVFTLGNLKNVSTGNLHTFTRVFCAKCVVVFSGFGRSSPPLNRRIQAMRIHE